MSDTSTASREATCDEPRLLASLGPRNCWLGESIATPKSQTLKLSLGFSGQYVYFLQQAGISPEDAFSFNLGSTAMAFVGAILSWFIMGRFGRRTIMVWGTSGLTTL